MPNNPFSTQEVSKPLEQELCQRIHYAAMVRAARSTFVEDVPPTLDLTTVRQRAVLFGKEVYLEHPETIRSLFAGISLYVYRAIRSLYCSRLERSPLMVWRILRAMAHEVHADVPSYEAVWAICLYLEEERHHETILTVEKTPSSWWVAHTLYEFDADESDARTTKHMVLVCVYDLVQHSIRAYRFTHLLHVSETYGQVLFEALSLCRRPSPEGAAGLVWSLPLSIVIEHTLSPECERGCTRLGIAVEAGQDRPESLQTLLLNWFGEITRRAVLTEHWDMLFDSYVYKVTGSSPWHVKEEQAYLYRTRLGYMRDPAWQCPALRHFLPFRATSISRSGEVHVDGTDYADDLLPYWAEAPVTIRLSEPRAESVWVYLDGSLMCQALKRQLRPLSSLQEER